MGGKGEERRSVFVFFLERGRQHQTSNKIQESRKNTCDKNDEPRTVPASSAAMVELHRSLTEAGGCRFQFFFYNYVGFYSSSTKRFNPSLREERKVIFWILFMLKTRFLCIKKRLKISFYR